jgi:NAD(P)-dependent dehydrogenase (short-subunit alcohol dehydrogenase family)
VRLSGKIAIVTGGGSGIGRATVRRLAVEGAAVAIADLNPTSGQAFADDLQADGHTALFVRTDVGDEASVKNLVDETVTRFGKLDIMINNAGIGQHFVTDETTWWQLTRVNLTGVFLGCKHAARVMIPNRAGSIISTASHAGMSPGGMPLYGATKAGVISLTKNIANALIPHRIRVNAVSPGNLETPFGDPRRDDMMLRHWAGDPDAFADDPVARGEPRADVDLVERRKRIDSWHPSGDRAVPDDLAQGFAFLASDESKVVSGDTLLVTGHINPPLHVRRVLESRSRSMRAEPLEVSGKSVVVATENRPLREAIASQFERRGACVVVLDTTHLVDTASVEAQLDSVTAGTPLAAVVFGLRPDQGGDLATTSPDQWNDEIRANLRTPALIVEAAMPRLVPGGLMLNVSDAAGRWGGPGSPAYSTMAGALTFYTEHWAIRGLERRIRVNCLVAEDLSNVRCEPALGGPISAPEIAAVAGVLASEAPGMSGAQVDLGVTHPRNPDAW